MPGSSPHPFPASLLDSNLGPRIRFSTFSKDLQLIPRPGSGIVVWPAPSAFPEGICSSLFSLAASGSKCYAKYLGVADHQPPLSPLDK